MHSPCPSHPGFGLVRLLKWLGLGLVCLLALALAGVWGVGRAVPSLLDSALASRGNSGLTCETNDTNLFAGRIDLAGISILNPPTFKEREFVHVRRLIIDVQPLTFLSDGRRVIEEVTLDIDRVTLIGKGDLFGDNNATAIAKAFRRNAKSEAQAAVAAGETGARPPNFVIRRLHIRVGGVTLLQDAGTGQPTVLLKDDRELAFDAADVTSDNLADTVVAPLGGMALTRAASAEPDALLNATRRQLERIQK